MPATLDVARDEMLGAFRTAWNAGAGAVAGYVPDVLYDGVGTRTEGLPDKAWARVTVRHSGGAQRSLADASAKRVFEKTGIITVSVFAPLVVAGGLGVGEGLAKVAKGAFEGKSTSSGIWFRDVRVAEVGVTRAWYGWNVIAEFRYDELA